MPTMRKRFACALFFRLIQWTSHRAPRGRPQNGRIRQADRLRSGKRRYIIQKTRRRRRDDAENSHLRRRRRRPRADRGGPSRLCGRASGAQHRDDRLFLRLCDAGRLREGRLSGYRPAGHLYARNAGDRAGAGHPPVQRKYGHSFPDDQLGLRGGRLRAPRRGLHSKSRTRRKNSTPRWTV